METEKTVSIRAHTQQTTAQGGRLKPAAITPEEQLAAPTSSPSPLHLEALEVSLVLKHLHERHLACIYVKTPD